MKELQTGRSTRLAPPNAISTWHTAARHGRAPIRIAIGHLEKEQRLENALDEYCLLREQNRSLTASRFCDRYPSYRQSLLRLIDVHNQIENEPAAEDENWPELFTEFSGYEILHELGVGAIARVYLATEAALGGRLVAIKVSREGGDEAETLGKLSHPNIVPVFSVKYDELSELTAVCMPYYGSATLADLLEICFQDGTPPTSASMILGAAREREQIVDFVESIHESGGNDPAILRGNFVDGIVRLGIQMADALAYTHERGILHRDLKPSNVLLTPSGVPMLLDFNLASDIQAGKRRMGGTLPYMPPEQIRAVHLRPFQGDLDGDPRSDIFSLGVILYELLTGRLPFGDPPACAEPRQAAEEFLAAQQRVPRAIRELNPAVSFELAQLLHNCLALEPRQRPASAAELASELRRYFLPRRRAQRWTSRHRGLVATLVLVCSLMTATATLHFATRPPYAVREYNAGVANIERERYLDAVVHLDHALELHENSVPFRFARGIAHQRLGDHKQAEIDLSQAAKQADDAFIMECCAYSQMKMSQTAPGSAIAARMLYSKASTLTELSAETNLNWAFANFEDRPIPALIIARCTAALDKRADWQAAYHLRGIGHYLVAKQQLAKKEGTRDENLLSRSISDARSDFERAISIGPANGRLFADAIQAFMLPLGDASNETLRRLVQSAALHGMPRALLTTLGAQNNWLNESWFIDILASCLNQSSSYHGASYGELFLSAPSPEAVASHLKTDRTRLAPSL